MSDLPVATKEMMKGYRMGYLAHAQTASFNRRVEKSREIISDFLRRGLTTRVMWSGGKDSTAMLHLAYTLDEDIVATSEKDDMDFPGEKGYVKHVAEKYQVSLDILEPEGSLWEGLGDVDVTEDLHSRGTTFSDEHFYSLLEAYHERQGVEGIMLGLRKHESGGRYANRLSRGHTYQKEDGMWVCCPIVDWTAKDVFAYLISRDVPILEVYFKTKLSEGPESIRKSWVLPGRSSKWGQSAWLRYHYPEVYSRIAETNDEITRAT